jgi:cell division FtsZ-interacting protein ZapD
MKKYLVALALVMSTCAYAQGLSHEIQMLQLDMDIQRLQLEVDNARYPHIFQQKVQEAIRAKKEKAFEDAVEAAAARTALENAAAQLEAPGPEK